MRTSTKIAAGVAGAALAVATAGVAYAYWTTSGTGTGTAGVGDATSFTITQTGTPSGLVPGGAPQSVDFSVNNPATTAQYVSSVSATLVSVTDGTSDGAKPACTVADFDLVQPSIVPGDIAGGASRTTTGATVALKNTATNQDNCKLATLNLKFDAA